MGLIKHQGTLYKSPPINKLNNQGSWHERYFVLAEIGSFDRVHKKSRKGKFGDSDTEKRGQHLLIYWKNEAERKAGKEYKGKILLHNCSVSAKGTLQFHRMLENVIELTTPRRIFYLSAASHDEMKQWETVLESSICWDEQDIEELTDNLYEKINDVVSAITIQDKDFADSDSISSEISSSSESSHLRCWLELPEGSKWVFNDLSIIAPTKNFSLFEDTLKIFIKDCTYVIARIPMDATYDIPADNLANQLSQKPTQTNRITNASCSVSSGSAAIQRARSNGSCCTRGSASSITSTSKSTSKESVKVNDEIEQVCNEDDAYAIMSSNKSPNSFNITDNNGNFNRYDEENKSSIASATPDDPSYEYMSSFQTHHCCPKEDDHYQTPRKNRSITVGCPYGLPHQNNSPPLFANIRSPSLSTLPIARKSWTELPEIGCSEWTLNELTIIGPGQNFTSFEDRLEIIANDCMYVIQCVRMDYIYQIPVDSLTNQIPSRTSQTREDTKL